VVTLSYMEDIVGLDVRDDGTGFAAPRNGGFGLTAMRQRVQGLAGTLEIEIRAGRRHGDLGVHPRDPGWDLVVIRLMIVDDHPVVRDGLTGIFSGEEGFEVVGEASNGADAVRRAGALNPDVILMDLRMPGSDGVGAITELQRAGVGARVLVLNHSIPEISTGLSLVVIVVVLAVTAVASLVRVRRDPRARAPAGSVRGRTRPPRDDRRPTLSAAR
jgi:CheY-like chemotaxis protein